MSSSPKLSSLALFTKLELQVLHQSFLPLSPGKVMNEFSNLGSAQVAVVQKNDE